jgi:hypothetical protein
MNDSEVLNAIYAFYYQRCQSGNVPCPPHIQMADEHTRRAIIMLAGIIHSQLVEMVAKEKNRG